MLTLTIKKKWFDMVINYEKDCEYREIKPYWTKRFSRYFEIEERELMKRVNDSIKYKETYWAGGKPKNIKLRNGYSNDSPYAIVRATLMIGEGMVEYGANINEIYYCLLIIDILEVRNVKEGDIIDGK